MSDIEKQLAANDAIKALEHLDQMRSAELALRSTIKCAIETARQAQDKTEALQAENKRLREALESIADTCYPVATESKQIPSSILADGIGRLATQVLKQEDEL